MANFVLEQFAREITPRSPSDVLFRYGGDEFIIVSKLGTNIQGGYGFAERLHRDVGAVEFLVRENSADRISLTISAGVTGFILARDDRKSLLARAAQALHSTKQPRTSADGVTKAKDFVYVLTEKPDEQPMSGRATVS